MSRRSFNVSFAIEVIVQIGVGLYLLKPRAEFPLNPDAPPPWIDWAEWYAGGFLMGVLLVMGPGLFAELARKRSPSGWGWGRTSISVEFLVLLITGFVYTLMNSFRLELGSVELLRFTILHFDPWDYLGPAAFATVATWWMSRHATAPAADAREISGRLVSVSTMMLYAVLKVHDLTRA